MAQARAMELNPVLFNEPIFNKEQFIEDAVSLLTKARDMIRALSNQKAESVDLSKLTPEKQIEKMLAIKEGLRIRTKALLLAENLQNYIADNLKAIRGTDSSKLRILHRILRENLPTLTKQNQVSGDLLSQAMKNFAKQYPHLAADVGIEDTTNFKADLPSFESPAWFVYATAIALLLAMLANGTVRAKDSEKLINDTPSLVDGFEGLGGSSDDLNQLNALLATLSDATQNALEIGSFDTIITQLESYIGNFQFPNGSNGDGVFQGGVNGEQEENNLEEEAQPQIVATATVTSNLVNIRNKSEGIIGQANQNEEYQVVALHPEMKMAGVTGWAEILREDGTNGFIFLDGVNLEETNTGNRAPEIVSQDVDQAEAVPAPTPEQEIDGIGSIIVNNATKSYTIDGKLLEEVLPGNEIVLVKIHKYLSISLDSDSISNWLEIPPLNGERRFILNDSENVTITENEEPAITATPVEKTAVNNSETEIPDEIVFEGNGGDFSVFTGENELRINQDSIIYFEGEQLPLGIIPNDHPFFGPDNIIPGELREFTGIYEDPSLNPKRIPYILASGYFVGTQRRDGADVSTSIAVPDSKGKFHEVVVMDGRVRIAVFDPTNHTLENLGGGIEPVDAFQHSGEITGPNGQDLDPGDQVIFLMPIDKDSRRTNILAEGAGNRFADQVLQTLDSENSNVVKGDGYFYIKKSDSLLRN